MTLPNVSVRRKAMPVSSPIEVRFLNQINKTDDCWLWTGRPSKGYGKLWIGRFGNYKKSMYAHRYSYERIHGTVPEGLELDHLCRTKLCVRPDHLEVVTHAENMRRADLTNNGRWQRIKTHCPQGHEYNEENTYTWKRQRRCRICNRNNQNKRR